MRILYLSPIPFDGLKQRPQYIAEGLAHENDVCYLDPTVSLMRFLLKGGDRPGGYTYYAEPRLRVARLNGSFSAHRSLEAITGLFRFPEKMQIGRYLKDADLVWVGYSPWFEMISKFPGIIVYDKMDDDLSITQNHLMRKLILQAEPALIRRADIIFATAQKLREDIEAMGKQADLLPNAVYAPDFKKMPDALPETHKRIFGYVGMISHWFDMDAVMTILRADTRNHVILVGPSEVDLPTHERLTWTGRVPKEDVAGWIASFDVCLYPFTKTAFLDTIDPVKIYEYLALNKPVLAAKSRETVKFGQRLYRYDNQTELRSLLNGEMQKPFRSEADRVQFITDNNWDKRVELVLKKLQMTCR
jgi:glycosyltransferase involved in cell wall biosynthesis